MELPITIVFEPPSLDELRALLRRRWAWVLTVALLAASVGTAALVVSASRAEALATSSQPLLTIESTPSGAEAWLDGRRIGHTPAHAVAAPGHHRVRLATAGAAETDYEVEVDDAGGALHAVLWRNRAAVTRVRPALPGATVASAHLLPDGRLDVRLRLGGGPQLQAWRVDPRSGEQQPASGDLAGARLELSAQDDAAAYVGHEIGPLPSGRLGPEQILWLVAREPRAAAPRALWRAAANEAIVD
ncbi:MAG: PEGA domain-containing protein, partial [Chloroflexota bacterium]|nr:PEGA domain-containing protein [Chloroflexota bacterium]